MNDDTCEADTEYCAAVSALVEGDASLSEQFWFLANGTEQDRNDIINFQQTYSSPVYDSAPAFMKEDFLFPYHRDLILPTRYTAVVNGQPSMQPMPTRR